MAIRERSISQGISSSVPATFTTYSKSKHFDLNDGNTKYFLKHFQQEKSSQNEFSVGLTLSVWSCASPTKSITPTASDGTVTRISQTRFQTSQNRMASVPSHAGMLQTAINKEQMEYRLYWVELKIGFWLWKTQSPLKPLNNTEEIARFQLNSKNTPPLLQVNASQDYI